MIIIQSQNDYGCVVRIVYFVKTSICDALPLSQCNDNEGKVKVSGLNSWNYNNRNFHRVQKVLLLISLPLKYEK